jgi:hypothetical protein
MWTLLMRLGTVQTECVDHIGSHGDVIEERNVFHRNKHPRESVSKQRALVPCGKTTFAVYNSTSNTSNELRADPYFFSYPRGRILLDTYPNGMINIITNVDTSECPNATTVRCVNTTLGNFRRSIQRAAPYTLYGDNPVTGQISTRKPSSTGYQILSAKAYSQPNCTGIPIAETINDIHLVPISVAAIRSTRFIAIYNGTTSPTSGVPKKDTNAIVNVTCQYIREAISYGFLYKQSLNFDYDSFKCFRIISTTPPIPGIAKKTNTTSGSLYITYQIIATISVYEYISPYLNPDMPTSQELSNYITPLFLNRATRGPGDTTFMSSHLRNRVVSPNVYLNFSKIVLA